MSLYYLPLINQYIGKRGFFTDDELYYADKLEKQWQETQQNLTFYELLKIFPEAKPAMRLNLKEQIRRYKQDLVEAEHTRVSYNNTILSRVAWQNRWFYELLRDIVYVNPLKEGRERRIKRNYYYLSALKPTAKETNGKITEADIARAKAVPIESLYTGTLCKKGSTLVGKCEFHRERTGSLTIYTRENRWWCFGENIGGDSVDYVLKRDGGTFIEAVKKLI